MRLRPNTAAYGRLALAALAVLLLAASADLAQAAGPFEVMAGSWSGSGMVNTSDGTHERVKCLAKYVSEKAGNGVQLDLRCATDSYKVEFTSSIVQSGGSLSGNWFERTRRVGGQISGKAAGDEVNVRASGQTFTALLNVKTQGTRQTFTMESPGAWIPEFTIALNRAQ
ncbi:MAG: hypothetical protein JO328_20405 [Hyphomicrobiales bacterium]|nr:hypothetical protein [Hyphomicrobiales bacterium]MBV8827005.1 hypothetical protein [Hyphomicrobiales bacterium]MBV9426956.1 hypothetical protein [Bradyrhizobiaceae bacterium]